MVSTTTVAPARAGDLFAFQRGRNNVCGILKVLKVERVQCLVPSSRTATNNNTDADADTDANSSPITRTVVHVRIYSNNLLTEELQSAAPEALGELKLGMAGLGIDWRVGFATGHMAMVEGKFDDWKREWSAWEIGVVDVKEEELDGYWAWKERAREVF